MENYCTTKLKDIYDNNVLDKDLAEKANKVYSFSLFKQSGQMDTEFYEIKREQDSRNIKKCKQLATNELNLQKSIYEEKISERNREIQRQAKLREKEKNESEMIIAIEKNNIKENNIKKNIDNQPVLSPLEFLKSNYISIMSLRDCRDSRKGYQKQYISEGLYQEALSAIRQIEKDTKKQIANLDEKKAWSEASEEYNNTLVGSGIFSIKNNTTWNDGFEQICLLHYFNLIASAPNAPKPVKEKDF